jgi:hypothetical protein
MLSRRGFVVVRFGDGVELEHLFLENVPQVRRMIYVFLKKPAGRLKVVVVRKAKFFDEQNAGGGERHEMVAIAMA